MNYGMKLSSYVACIALFAAFAVQDAEASVMQTAIDAGFELLAADDAAELERQRQDNIVANLPPITTVPYAIGAARRAARINSANNAYADLVDAIDEQLSDLNDAVMLYLFGNNAVDIVRAISRINWIANVGVPEVWDLYDTYVQSVNDIG